MLEIKLCIKCLLADLGSSIPRQVLNLFLALFSFICLIPDITLLKLTKSQQYMYQ